MNNNEKELDNVEDMIDDAEPNLENAREKPERMSISRSGRCKTQKERRRLSIFNISGVDPATEQNVSNGDKSTKSHTSSPRQDYKLVNDNKSKITQDRNLNRRKLEIVVAKTDNSITSFDWW